MSLQKKSLSTLIILKKKLMNRFVNLIKIPKVLAEIIINCCGFLPDELYVKLQNLNMGCWPLFVPLLLTRSLNG